MRCPAAVIVLECGAGWTMVPEIACVHARLCKLDLAGMRQPILADPASPALSSRSIKI